MIFVWIFAGLGCYTSLICSYWCFGTDGLSQNIGNCLPIDTASHHRWLSVSFTPWQKREITHDFCLYLCWSRMLHIVDCSYWCFGTDGLSQNIGNCLTNQHCVTSHPLHSDRNLKSQMIFIILYCVTLFTFFEVPFKIRSSHTWLTYTGGYAEKQM